MGAPVSGMQTAGQTTPETLLDSFKTISASERRKHATVLNYWLSIRGDRDFAPIRDLDPLELTDAAPCSILLELIGGGEDAEVRHVGEALRSGVEVSKLSEAPSPSLLSCIGAKLAIIAISRNVLAFEDEFETESGTVRCWVTLLPFSSSGTWVDYVYGFVTSQVAAEESAAAHEPAEPQAAEEEVAEPSEAAESAAQEPGPGPEPEPEAPPPVAEEVIGQAPASPSDADAEPQPSTGKERKSAAAGGNPGFSSKVFDAIAGVQGFFGTVISAEPKQPEDPAHQANEQESEPAEALPVAPPVQEPKKAERSKPEATVADDQGQTQELASGPEPTVEEAQPQSTHCQTEGPLQSKLTEVRSKADEARMAKLRANAALYEGLSAAYDFALDAEEQPEEYLKLVGEKGLKIQLRSPMAPVVRLAFDGLCDDSTISQLEAVLVWALQNDLPRGTLAERIEAAGGIGPILNGQAKAA